MHVKQELSSEAEKIRETKTVLASKLQLSSTSDDSDNLPTLIVRESAHQIQSVPKYKKCDKSVSKTSIVNGTTSEDLVDETSSKIRSSGKAGKQVKPKEKNAGRTVVKIPMNKVVGKSGRSPAAEQVSQHYIAETPKGRLTTGKRGPIVERRGLFEALESTDLRTSSPIRSLPTSNAADDSLLGVSPIMNEQPRLKSNADKMIAGEELPQFYAMEELRSPGIPCESLTSKLRLRLLLNKVLWL